MITDFSDLTLAVGVVGAALLIVFIVWNIIVRRRRVAYHYTPSSLDDVADAQIEKGEFSSSIISEQIEEKVKQILEEQGLSLGDELDFGTASDGSLQIWVSGQAYDELDEIPDSSVRDAVKKAVDEFNQ
jgi:hypothetical protein